MSPWRLEISIIFMEPLIISPFGIRRIYDLFGGAEKKITGGREILFPLAAKAAIITLHFVLYTSNVRIRGDWSIGGR